MHVEMDKKSRNTRELSTVEIPQSALLVELRKKKSGKNQRFITYGTD
jgi:hypothetical protein